MFFPSLAMFRLRHNKVLSWVTMINFWFVFLLMFITFAFRSSEREVEGQSPEYSSDKNSLSCGEGNGETVPLRFLSCLSMFGIGRLSYTRDIKLKLFFYPVFCILAKCHRMLSFSAYSFLNIIISCRRARTSVSGAGTASAIRTDFFIAYVAFHR